MIGVFLLVVMARLVSGGPIPKHLYDYLRSNDKLDRYSINMEFDRNSESRWYEENIYIRQDGRSQLDGNLLDGKTLNVGICKRDGYYDTCYVRTEMTILDVLKDVLNFTVNYNTYRYDINKMEVLNSYLGNDTIDLILCYPHENDHYKILHPVLKTRYILLYKPENLSFTQDIFVITFAGTLWLCFVIIIVILAFCLILSTNRYTNIYGHPSWGTVDITFWAIAAACQQGLSSTPVGFSSRTIFFLGYLMAYLLYTGFAAGITSLVAVQNEDYDLKISDIEKMQLNIVSFGDTTKIISQQPSLSKIYESNNFEDFFKQLDKSKWIGLTTLKRFEYYLNNTIENKYDPCIYGLTILEETEYVKSFSIPNKSTYKKLLNYWLINLDQSGIINVTSQHHGVDVPMCQELSGYSSAGLQHVGSAILLLLAGIIMSLLFLLLECIWSGYKHRKTIIYKTNTKINQTNKI